MTQKSFKTSEWKPLNRKFHAYYRYATQYCPQANVTVGHLCKEFLHASSVFISEFWITENEWPLVQPLLQRTRNNSTQTDLGRHTPITAFTGLPSDNPLRKLIPTAPSEPKIYSISKSRQNRASGKGLKRNSQKSLNVENKAQRRFLKKAQRDD